MAKFLTTTGVSAQLEEIIKQAGDRLWLISPFLKITPRIKNLLEDTNRLKIDARVIYGKNELQPEENIWLESMTSIRTSFCKDLHAKCYMNENEALLTSMNLYEYSQVNNYEMGILVSREAEPELYEEIYQEARRILRASEEIRVTVARVPNTENDSVPPPRRETQRKSQPTQKAPTTGFCIRCKTSVKVAAPKVAPYCLQCYRSWNRSKDTEHTEKHCHLCGNEYSTSFSKPACLSCYRTHKDQFDFAAT